MPAMLMPVYRSRISSAESSIPSSARQARSASTDSNSLSIRTPSQSKMTRSNAIAASARGLGRDNDDRNVVDGAARQHAIEQPARNCGRRACFSKLARDPGGGDHVGQPVAAQQEAAAAPERVAQ